MIAISTARRRGCRWESRLGASSSMAARVTVLTCICREYRNRPPGNSTERLCRVAQWHSDRSVETSVLTGCGASGSVLARLDPLVVVQDALAQTQVPGRNL